MRLPRSTPAAEGVGPAAIRDWIEALETQNLETHGIMVLRHGSVIAEGWWAPYGPCEPQLLYSLTKSFTATGIGFAVEDGLVDLDDRVIDLFPDALPAEVSDNLAAMRVRHCLTMSVGQSEDLGVDMEPYKGDWARGFMARPVPFAPGTHFLYNSTASNMLSLIVQKVSGQTLQDYLRPRLFDPLGINGECWEHGFGHTMGGWGLSLTLEDVTKFGLLYLQDGVWEGLRVLPAGWVQMATQSHVQNQSETPDWAQGYGFQFWRSRHNSFRGDGAFGQFCLVLPELDAVVAIHGGGGDMQKTLNAVWDHLLPAFRASSSLEGQDRLSAKLAGLSIPTVSRGNGVVPLGRVAKEGGDDPISEYTLAAASGGLELSWSDDGSLQVLRAEYDHWIQGSLCLEGGAPFPVGAKAYWPDAKTLAIKVCHLNAPMSVLFTIRTAGDQVTIHQERNANWLVQPKVKFVGRRID